MSTSLFLLVKGPGVWPRLADLFFFKNLIGDYVSNSQGQILGWAYIIFSYGQTNSLHNSQRTTLPTQWCLVLYSCANLLHSLIRWLMVSSLLPHNLHLPFFGVLSILTLIWLVLIALFCAVIWRDSVYLLRFPFLSHIYVFSFEMLLITRLKRP